MHNTVRSERKPIHWFPELLPETATGEIIDPMDALREETLFEWAAREEREKKNKLNNNPSLWK